MRKRNKYGNVKSGGYDSKKENRRSNFLKMLEKNGTISNLQEQVRFELVPSQYEKVKVLMKTKTKVKEKCVERAVNYIADFVYTDDKGKQVVEDSKGFKTPDYIIKRKLMLQVHGIKIREV